MATTQASEYLAKALQVDNKIVTFRLLSREISINVNVAKNELAAFHRAVRGSSHPVHATYIVSGEVSPPKASADDAMEVDNEDESEWCPTRKIVLASEETLEQTKAQFSSLTSVHVYSLSPSPIKDSTILLTTVDQVRKIDISRGPEHAKLVGTIINDQIGWPKSEVKGKAKEKEKPNPSSISTVDKKPIQPKDPKPKEERKVLPKPQEKKAGTLDWGKAAVKTKEEEKPKFRGTKRPSPTSDSEPTPLPVASAAPLKARHSFPPTKASTSKASDLSSNEKVKQTTSTSRDAISTVKIRKGVLISDDEEEEEEMQTLKPMKSSQNDAMDVDEDTSEESNNRKRRTRKSESAVDKSTRAMMDIDDEEMATPDSNSESEPEHVPLNKAEARRIPKALRAQKEKEPIGIDKASKNPKPRKKKAPLGRNGKPKRRVERSRMTTDEKGYMVSQDWSSYESVSGSEDEGSKEKTADHSKTDHDSDASEVKTKAKAEIKPRPKPRKSTVKLSAEHEGTSFSEVESSTAAPSKPRPKAKPVVSVSTNTKVKGVESEVAEVKAEDVKEEKADDDTARKGREKEEGKKDKKETAKSKSSAPKPKAPAGQQKIAAFFGKK